MYPGVIIRDRGDGTYDIDYDDGEKETRVQLNNYTCRFDLMSNR